ncbi:hypothetical protein OG21DRAFT_1523986 [Imleria badia]|nr:hypothetical protein OG21DRAFT_1523986 [Imleria badia]
MGVLGDSGATWFTRRIDDENGSELGRGGVGPNVAYLRVRNHSQRQRANCATVIANEQSTIKANKGMILRKLVEYIQYLQQLVSLQASRGRDLEEHNRLLERELVVLRGDVPPPSVESSVVLSLSSSSAADTVPKTRRWERGIAREQGVKRAWQRVSYTVHTLMNFEVVIGQRPHSAVMVDIWGVR